MNEYGFNERLEFSKGVVADTCEQTICDMLPGCVSVITTDVDTDKTGIDYVATLRHGATVGIDHKARDVGCSTYWQPSLEYPFGEPEIALETFSVLPINGNYPKAGWTLDESKKTDYTLHTYNELDTADAYLLPFQLLRVAFRRNSHDWTHTYKVARQNSVIFMWSTSPLLDDAMSLMVAWGFDYKTSFVWDKVKHNFGHYNSVRHELLLIGTRGSCTPDRSVTGTFSL